MTGLEKILKHIEDEATATAETVLLEAKCKAEEITATAQAEGIKKREEIMGRSKVDVQACLSRAESSALLQEKKLILVAKQQIISAVIDKSKETLLKMPKTEYSDVIIKMVDKYALDQPGQILFSRADKERLIEQFQDTLQSTILRKKIAKLILSEDTRDIDGGFVLIYGDVEINCSFDALFFAARESLQDKVCKVLFD